MQSTPEAADRLARRAAALAFATQGLVFISLTTRLPRFSDRWDLSEVELSLLLLMIVLLAGAGSVVAERSAHRSSTAPAPSAPGCSPSGSPCRWSPPRRPARSSSPALAVYGVGLGIVDATSNMQAVAVEHRYGRTILPSFHGAWTFGGIIGAVLALAAAHAAALDGRPGRRGAARWPSPRRTSPASTARPLAAAAQVAVPWRPIVLVGLGMVLFYMVDTAAQTWGPTYLDDVVDAPQSLVALATLPYLVASLVVRLAGDRLVARYGAVPVLRTGAVVASLALLVVVTSPTWPVAVLGFTLLGAGVSVIAPLSFSAAARIAGGDRARVDAVIARFNQFNYVGGLLGAVLTGLVGRRLAPARLRRADGAHPVDAAAGAGLRAGGARVTVE